MREIEPLFLNQTDLRFHLIKHLRNKTTNHFAEMMSFRDFLDGGNEFRNNYQFVIDYINPLSHLNCRLINRLSYGTKLFLSGLLFLCQNDCLLSTNASVVKNISSRFEK